MIKKEILEKLSDEALLAVMKAVQEEYDSRMDYSLRFGEKCYAIIKGKREDFILNKFRRTKAEVTCVLTGTNYLIPIAVLKADGRRREKPITREAKAQLSGVPTSTAPVASW